MKVGADAEHEVDLDIRMMRGEALEQRLAIATLGRRQDGQASTRPPNQPATRHPVRHGGGGDILLHNVNSGRDDVAADAKGMAS